MSKYFDIEKRIDQLEKDKLRSNLLMSIHREKIGALVKLTESVNKNYNAKAVLGMLDQSLTEIMKVKHFALYVKTKSWKLMLNTGVSLENVEVDFENDLNYILKTQNTERVKNTALKEFSSVIPVLHKNEQVAFLFIKDIEIEELGCSTEEKLRFIESLLSLTIISLQNKKLFKQSKIDINNEDLIIAAEVQAELIPSVFPINKHFEFSGKYIPFDIIGGDYYDFINIDEDNIAFCICDVAGKGVSAGMLMSNFQAALRTLISRDYDLKNLVSALNEKVLNITKQFRYITMFIAMYNTKTRKLQYVNAGHNHPVLKNGEKIIKLTKGCTILGMIKDLGNIEVGEKILEENAILVMYTDGLSEIENDQGEEFGIKNITKYIQNNEKLVLKNFTNKLIDEVEVFKGENEIFDDVSLLCARFFKP